MKCLFCGHVYPFRLKKVDGVYDLKKAKCPKCGSKKFSMGMEVGQG